MKPESKLHQFRNDRRIAGVLNEDVCKLLKFTIVKSTIEILLRTFSSTYGLFDRGCFGFSDKIKQGTSEDELFRFLLRMNFELTVSKMRRNIEVYLELMATCRPSKGEADCDDGEEEGLPTEFKGEFALLTDLVKTIKNS